MSETWLSVGGTPSVKVVLKDIQPYRGIGVTRLLFTFEITSKHQSVLGGQLWLGGRIEVADLPQHTRPYLTSFLPHQLPIALPDLGVDQTLQLPVEITDQQLQLIEDQRTAGIRVYLCLAGYVLQGDGRHLPVHEAQFAHDIGQSDWITMLGQMGYRRRLLLELEPPDPQTHPDFAEAIDHYLQAQHRYLEGAWRLTVESLRQALAALVGRKPDEEEQEADVQGSIRSLRNDAHSAVVAYGPRLELVRQAAKFMCDLGAHPETAETRREHAYSALMIVSGLLHAFTRS